MKTKEELKALKEEYITLTTKLKELNEDELKELSGGVAYDPFVKHKETTNQDVATPSHDTIVIRGLETIGPYAVGGIPLDSDSKLKS